MKKIRYENEKMKEINLQLLTEEYGEHIDGLSNIVMEKNFDKKIMRKYESIFRRFKMQPPIKVPVRLNGKTGRGVFKGCHSNVATLVERIGGKAVRGYMLSRIVNQPMTAFIWHSVWQTPEGKLVDVTTSSTKEYRDISEITFIPVVTFDPSKKDYWFIQDFIVYDDRHKGLIIRDEENFDQNVPFNYLKKHVLELYCLNIPWTKNETHLNYVKKYGSNVFDITQNNSLKVA